MPGKDITVGNLIVGVATKLTDFKKGLKEVDSGFAKMGKSIEKGRKTVNTAGLAIAGVGAAVGGALVASIVQAAKFGDEMDKMSGRTGIGAKELSAFAFIAERSGTSLTAVEVALRKTQKNLVDAAAGTGLAKDAFIELDINVKNADGTFRVATEVMLEFAEKTKNMTDSSKKAALAQEIFGKAGTELLPMFAGGKAAMEGLRKEAEKYGVVIDDVAATQGAELVDSMTNFQASIKGVSTVFTQTMLPLVTQVMNIVAESMSKLAEWIGENQDKIKKATTSVINFIANVIEGWISVIQVVDNVFDAIIVTVTTALGKVFDAFRWLLEKLGIEIPDIGQLFEDMGDTGESTADKLREKWDGFRDSFAENMEANADAHDVATDDIALEEFKLTQLISKEEVNRTKKAEEEAQKKKDANVAADDEIFANRKEKQEEEELATLHWFDELQKTYDYVLTEEQLKQAEVLENMNQDWKQYLDAVTEETPKRFDFAFEGVAANFDTRINDMADMWMDDILHGNFKNSFDFMGEYIQQTFKATFVDIQSNVISKFTDFLKNKISGALTGEGGIASSILGSLGGGAGGLLGGLGGAAGALGGVAAVAAPLAIAGAVGYGAYKLGEEIFASMGYKHTSQRERSRKATKDQSHVAARWAGYKGLSSGLNYTKMNARLMNETMFWADKTDMSPEDAADRGSRSLAHQLQNDFGSAGLSAGRAAEIGQILHDAVLGYRSGTLQSMADEGIFHAGGIIPGALGQERMIRALSGEEVLTRKDPRHSMNVGSGMKVIITGNNINSEMDMMRLARLAGDEIMRKIKLQTEFVR